MRKVRHDSGSGEEYSVEKTFHKGPWTSAEDQLLIAYVDKHGDGNWNAVQKHSGLSRCGKSCRLRWVNHLRPDLKKGAFTDKEEQRVIKLHASMGNKWARMASELPGRTDNEIKNFWNTRLKRLQRLGLPIYPDEVREQAMNAAAQSGHNADSMDGHHSQESLEPDTLEIPEVDFKYLQLNQCSSYYQSMLRSVPTGNLMRQRQCFYQPNMYNMIGPPPYLPNRKRFREPEIMDGYVTNEQSSQLWSYPFVDSSQEQQLPDSHLFGNATYSSPSGPLYHETAEKLELPSFQCFEPQEEPGDWGGGGTQESNPMPALESDNTLVQSPLSPSSFCDGLLESVVYGSSGEKRTSNTDSDSPLLQSSLLDHHTELTPATANTTGHNSNFETDLSHFVPNERRTSFEGGDWIRQLLGEDRDYYSK
ncbi:unnamed protein product [Microthlaspi erraticum]|uniref:Uncharacterized protein n=1 Tax=Microthlaspi erraticum TaxID=1685480 RepID=A0A6D2HUX4_9BRAS|nr:unnamed protein product [Microthlaspi erraticum]